MAAFFMFDGLGSLALGSLLRMMSVERLAKSKDQSPLFDEYCAIQP